MKIVITGSRGFIGSHLVKTLQNENEIIEWDTKIDKDIKDFTLEPDTDFVVHLAGLISPRDSNLFNIFSSSSVRGPAFSICSLRA